MKSFLAGTLPLVLVLSASNVARPEPFVPKNGSQVLERVRYAAFDPAARELRELRARLARQPENLSLAAQLARRCIERCRAESDPRFLGHAQAALAPWWDQERPPVEALVLRAIIRQSQHHFTNALADLALALQSAPTDTQARLTQATILTVLGRYAEARRACLPLIGHAPELIAIGTIASIDSLNGQAERSCQLLRRTLDRNPSASPSEKLWTLTVLAETSARLGDSLSAQGYFKRALALGQRDAYLLGAYADFLLDAGRDRDVAVLLKDESRAGGLLLCLTLAEAGLNPRPATFNSHLVNLRERFEASRLRGDTVHQREEARFALRLLHDPGKALRLAQANWEIQREPADARILLESALAANEPVAAQPALVFIRNSRLEDVHLTNLAQRFVVTGTR